MYWLNLNVLVEMKNRVNSFTIAELIVTMLVGSILLVILWSSYFIIKKYYNSGEKQNEEAVEIILFENQLRKDFDKASVVKYKNNKLELINISSKLEYIFLEGKVIRKQLSRTDTILIKVKDINFDYIEGNFFLQSIIKNMEISILRNESELRFFFLKEYDFKFLYNFYKNTNNQ